MIGLSRLWDVFSTGQNEDDNEPSADSESDPSDDQGEQDDETIELSVTVEQLTISSGDET